MCEIAVIGMSCRFPGANSNEKFWENLIKGKDSVTSLPSDRWYMNGFRNLNAGYLSCRLDEFDYNFFHISPKEAAMIDPQQRLFMEVSWESLEDAGIPPLSLSGSITGVFVGISSDDYWRHHVNSENEKMYALTGNSHSAAPGKLSNFLNLRGPSLAHDATCASSALAIHTAVQSLQFGDCNLALAGGVNIILQTDTIFPPEILSENCRSFSKSASGFAPGEGCGVVVLKRLSEARADRNQILGIIRATGVNHTGRSTSFGTPTIRAEETLMSETLKKAGLNPSQISYIEGHAGGTPVGDPIEFAAISNIFSKFPRDRPLIIGNSKPNIGHSLAAAGIAGLIKTLLCVKHRTIPPQLHLHDLHPDIDLTSVPALIPTMPTQITGSPIRALINSFGITGTNVNIILEESLAQKTHEADTLSSLIGSHIMAISANDEEALEALRVKYVAAIERAAHNGASTESFIFTSNCGRSHMHKRLAVTGSSLQTMGHKLRNGEYFIGSPKSGPIAFIFTGHGCQYFGMGRELYDSNESFREAMDQCNIIYKTELGLSLFSFLWEEGHDLRRTKFSQPAIFCLEISLFKFWIALGLVPDIVMGHSIGEFAAAVAAEVIPFEAALKLICYRSKVIDLLPEACMLAVSTSRSRIEDLIVKFGNSKTGVHAGSDWIDIACENSSEQTVVSTTLETGKAFELFLARNYAGLKVKVILSAHAFHSRAMDQILDDYEKYATGIIATCSAKNGKGVSKSRFISSVTGTQISTTEINAAYWRNHCRQPVKFSSAAQLLLAEKECPIFVELSPQPTLLNFILAENSGNVDILGLPSIRRGHDPWLTLTTTLAKLYINTNTNWNFRAIYKDQNLVPLPKYAWNRKQCWTKPRFAATVIGLPTPRKPSYSQFMVKSKIQTVLNWSKGQSPALTKNRSWLIFGTKEDPIQDGITKMLTAHAQNVIRVQVGSYFDREGDTWWNVNPRMFPDFQALAHLLGNTEIEGIIYLWGLTLTDSQITTAEEFQKQLITVNTGLLHVFQMQVKCSWVSKTFIITRGFEDVNPSQGTLWGLNKSYISGFPHNYSMTIDLDLRNKAEVSISQIWQVLNSATATVERGIYFKGTNAFVTRLENFKHDLPDTVANLNNENLDDKNAQPEQRNEILNRKNSTCSQNFKNVDSQQDIPKVNAAKNVELTKSDAAHYVKPLFKANRTYIVTCCPYDIGFEVGKFIYHNGGKILLVGAEKQSDEQVREMAKFQKAIAYVAADLSNFKLTKILLEKLDPPIGGIFHCAVSSPDVQHDGILGETIKGLEIRFKTTVFSIWNLHKLTKEMKLDYFVIISSVLGISGCSASSTAWAAANCYLDSLKKFHVHRGVMLSLNIICQRSEESFNSPTRFGENTNAPVVKYLEKILRLGGTEIIVADLNETAAAENHPMSSHLPNSGNSRSGLQIQLPKEMVVSKISPIESLRQEIFSAKSRESRVEKLELFVENVFKHHTGTPADVNIDPSVSFSQMGMDSLIAMEIRMSIRKILQVELHPNVLLERNTIHRLAKHLNEQLNFIAHSVEHSRNFNAALKNEKEKISDKNKSPRRKNLFSRLILRKFKPVLLQK